MCAFVHYFIYSFHTSLDPKSEQRGTLPQKSSSGSSLSSTRRKMQLVSTIALSKNSSSSGVPAAVVTQAQGGFHLNVIEIKYDHVLLVLGLGAYAGSWLVLQEFSKTQLQQSFQTSPPAQWSPLALPGNQDHGSAE